MTVATSIRPAATLIVVRGAPGAPKVLMGQRGSSAAFMPSKFVFPGGAVDPGDAAVPLAGALPHASRRALGGANCPGAPESLAVAAIRELWEETGLALGVPGRWPTQVPGDWLGFAELGLIPTAAPLTFVFRAITPHGRPRRFDAHFFLADAAHIAGDADDFSRAGGELSHLQWVPLDEARAFDLPFITEVVLAEVAAKLRGTVTERGIPFFDNSGPVPTFRRIA